MTEPARTQIEQLPDTQRAALGGQKPTHLAYGLALQSDIDLPHLPRLSDDIQAEVLVRKRRETVSGLRTGNEEGRYVEGHAQSFTIGWSTVGELLVRDGRTVDVSALEGIEDDTLGPLVLGVGMGVLLSQRGEYVLHASAVSVAQGTVALVGFKGDGKSTLAASFVGRGHQLVTDDVLALRWEESDAPLPRQGYGGLKLWPEVFHAVLGESEIGHPRVHPDFEKRILWPGLSATPPPPLVAVYVLAPGSAISIDRIDGQASVIEFLRHAYVPRFLPSLGSTEAHLVRALRLARSVPIFRLARPPGLNLLSQVVKAVENHTDSLVDTLAQKPVGFRL